MKLLFSSLRAGLSRLRSRTLLTAALLVAIVVVGAISFSVSHAAGAASVTPKLIHGQQLEVITNEASVLVRGRNQYGRLVTHCFNTPHRINYLTGWFWEGPVMIGAYTLPGCRGARLCTVVVNVPLSSLSRWIVVRMLCGG